MCFSQLCDKTNKNSRTQKMTNFVRRSFFSEADKWTGEFQMENPTNSPSELNEGGGVPAGG